MKFAAQPQVAALSRFGPQLASPSPLPDLALSIKGTPRFPGLADVVTAPFSGRQGMERATLVRREGGTVHSEKAVEHGIEWIVRHQKSDGSWSLNYHEQCQAQACPPEFRACWTPTPRQRAWPSCPCWGPGTFTTSNAATKTPSVEDSSGSSSISKKAATCTSGGAVNSHFYSHAIATMALCEAYGLSRDPKLKGTGETGDRLHLCGARPRVRRLAILPRPARRYVGLRMEHLRPAQRPPGRPSLLQGGPSRL